MKKPLVHRFGSDFDMGRTIGSEVKKFSDREKRAKMDEQILDKLLGCFFSITNEFGVFCHAQEQERGRRIRVFIDLKSLVLRSQVNKIEE